VHSCVWRSMHVFADERAVHKRAAQTLEGFFVGVQHPMALVIRKSDMKLISVSKKKLVVYESCYTAPLSFSSDRLRLAIEQGLEEPTPKDQPILAGEQEQRIIYQKPDQVQSIESMRDHMIPRPNTTASSAMRSPTKLGESAATQFPGCSRTRACKLRRRLGNWYPRAKTESRNDHQ
jgi:hypothetical protein